MIEVLTRTQAPPIVAAGLTETAEAAFFDALAVLKVSRCIKHISVLSLYHLPYLPAVTRTDGSLFVIVGCGLLLLYMPAIGKPGIEHVLAYLVEGHDPSLWRDLRAHYRNEGQALTFSPLYLDMLPFMVESLMPGWVVTLDVAKGEILSRKALYHPSRDRRNPRSGRLENGRHLYRPLRPRMVNPCLRQGLPQQLDELADPFCGVVKEEAAFFNTAGMPQHITRIRKGGATTGGRSPYRERARALSYCEAVERFQTDHHEPERVVRATYGELGGEALDPLRFFCYPPPRAGMTRGHGEPCLDWVWADNLSTGRRILVPADRIALAGDGEKEHPWIPCTTNGVALGGSYEEAVLYGIFEFIERDSFLTAWRLWRRCKQLDPRSLNDPDLHVLLAAMAFRHPSYDLHFFDTTTDTELPSVWVIAVRRGAGVGMKTLSAASCRLTFRSAMNGALNELAGLMSFNLTFEEKIDHYRRCLGNASEIVSIEDHLGYYGLDEAFNRFAFFDFESPPLPVVEPRFDFLPQNQNRYDLKAIIEGVLELLSVRDMEVVVRDLTSAEFKPRGLFCVKTAITDLLPLSFGPHLAGFHLSQRLKALARQWGRGEMTMQRINREPHPMG